jgi:hypothetical protein
MRKLLWVPCPVVFLLSLFAPETACASADQASAPAFCGRYFRVADDPGSTP